MWAVAVDAGGPGDALVYAVWTFLGVVVATLGTIAVQAMRSRAERTTASQATPPADSAVLVGLAKEQGSLVQRADDNDERDDMQDRRHERSEDRLEALEQWATHHDPDWRH